MDFRTAMSEESSFVDVTAPDVVSPAQWYAGVHRDEPRFHGTKQLMLAFRQSDYDYRGDCAPAR